MHPHRQVLIVSKGGLLADITAEHLLAAGHDVRIASDPRREPWGEVTILVLEGSSGYTAAIIAAARPKRPVALLVDEEVDVVGALAAGASTVMTTASSPSMLVAAMELTAGGACVLPPESAAAIVNRLARAMRVGAPNRSPSSTLTEREVDVLAAMSVGRSTKAVAKQLQIAIRTVEAHKANVFRKLGVRTQAQAVAAAIDAGLVPQPRLSAPVVDASSDEVPRAIWSTSQARPR